MPSYYPPVGFHFLVEVLGLPKPSDADTRFSDVGGLAVELGTEEVAEGGQNQYLQKYPVRAKYPELVLKRGLLVDSALVEWIRDAMEHLRLDPKDVDVKLLNAEHQPLITWHVRKAYPTKWSVSDFAASGNAIVVESLQLFYQSFTVDRQGNSAWAS
jgi:phage tail-like protein